MSYTEELVNNETERCIDIVEKSLAVLGEFVRTSLPSSYDATELRDGTVETIRILDEGRKMEWRIRRLLLRGILSRIKNLPMGWDADDDRAVMELGYVP